MALLLISCHRCEIHANVFQIPLIEACPQDGVDEFSRNMNSINVSSLRDFFVIIFFLFYWFIVYCGWYGHWFWIGLM